MTAATVRSLIENDEDFEWYPTTREIISTVANDFIDQRENSRSDSILDIGAGDGRVLVGMEATLRARDQYACVDLFAIEKAITHLSAMPKHITVVGTVFEEQSLADKSMTAIFCNPPYSQFADWLLKIISEASAEMIYLVVPVRWRSNNAIQTALEKRSGSVTSLGEFDFENAERAARARVEVIRIMFDYEHRDAFDAVLESMLPELDVFDVEMPEEDDPAHIDRTLLKAGRNLIEVFVESYERDLMRMLNNYKGALAIDPRILSEIGASKRGLLDAIKLKIKGLKNRYWEMLFNELDTVTKRLATKQRKAFLDSLRDKVTIDFTEKNIYSVLIWVSKWANDYFDEQLIELFRTLSTESCVIRYKSNDKVWTKGNWRYLRSDEEGPTHYRLEYRIVLSHGGIETSDYAWRREQCRGLTESAFDLLMDIVTVANNLGFSCSDSPKNYWWESNVQHTLRLDNGKPLITVRAFKNGNMHFHFDPKVMLAINVEAGRLLKWIRTPQEACEEIEIAEADAKNVARMFGSSFRIGSDAGLLKLCAE